jgi:hypothetical protein
MDDSCGGVMDARSIPLLSAGSHVEAPAGLFAFAPNVLETPVWRAEP